MHPHPTDEQWTAHIEGADWIQPRRFWMPAGSTEDQARYRCWLVWSRCRVSDDVNMPQVRSELRLAKVAAEPAMIDREAA